MWNRPTTKGSQTTILRHTHCYLGPDYLEKVGLGGRGALP